MTKLTEYVKVNWLWLTSAIVMCVTDYYVAQYIAIHSIGPRLILGQGLSDGDVRLGNPAVLMAIAERILASAVLGVYAVAFAISFLRHRVDLMVGLFVLSLPIASVRNIDFFTFYVDSAGFRTTLNQTSVLLSASFVALVLADKTWISGVLKKRLLWPFFVLVCCGLVTQSYHLGLVAGVGITFVRVLQPFMFIVLISWCAQSQKGFKQLFFYIGMSVILAIALRFSMPELTDAATGRSFAVGSWTIYGTLIAASLAYIVCLGLVDRRPVVRVLMGVCVLVIVPEIFRTGTRGAIISLIALGLFALLKLPRSLIVGIAVVVWVLISGLGRGSNLELSGNRPLSLDPYVLVNDYNANVRFARNAQGLEYMLSHPVTGLGLGQPTMESGYEIAFWVYNPYLAWGVPMGILALLAFAAVMVQSSFQAIRNYLLASGESRAYQLAIGISLIIWVVNQFTTADSMTYLQSVESTLYFYAVIGMILGQQPGICRPSFVARRLKSH